MSFAYYRMIDKSGVKDNFVKGSDEPICYNCSLKLDPEKDQVIIACAITERYDLRCEICNQLIKEEPIINETHKFIKFIKFFKEED